MESALVHYNGDLLSSQQLNAHPSSDQLKAWSGILSGALSGSSSVFPTLSQVRVILLLPQIQLFISNSAQRFGNQINHKLRGRCFVIVMLEKDMCSWTPIRPDFIEKIHFWAFRSLFLDWKVNFEALLCTSKPKVKLKFSSWLTAVLSLANQIIWSILTSVVIGWN